MKATKGRQGSRRGHAIFVACLRGVGQALVQPGFCLRRGWRILASAAAVVFAVGFFAGLYEPAVSGAAELPPLNADSTFTKITNGLIVTETGRSVGCIWGDYDNDGWARDGDSCLRVERIAATGSATLWFTAISNRTYTVQFKDSLSEVLWSKLMDVVAQPVTHVESVVDPNPGTNRYYRLVTPRQGQ